MTTTTLHHRIKGHRSASTRIDPYTIDEMTLTLAEWRDAQIATAKGAHPAGSGRCVRMGARCEDRTVTLSRRAGRPF
jgi:hypothetical protein